MIIIKIIFITVHLLQVNNKNIFIKKFESDTLLNVLRPQWLGITALKIAVYYM